MSDKRRVALLALLGNATPGWARSTFMNAFLDLLVSLTCCVGTYDVGYHVGFMVGFVTFLFVW